ncbi:hypothetical protein SK128_007358, partial [Halocaridina rubra]
MNLGSPEKTTGIQISRSLDFQKIRNSFRRKPKTKTFSRGNTHELSGDLHSRSGNNSPLPEADINVKSSSLSDFDDVEKNTYFPSLVGASDSKESLKDRLFGKLKWSQSSNNKYDISNKGSRVSQARAAEKSSDEETSKKGNLMSRVKNLYGSRTIPEKNSVESLEDSSAAWKGVRLLHKFYGKEETLDHLDDTTNARDPLFKTKPEESYWKGVRFLDKAQTLYMNQNFDEEMTEKERGMETEHDDEVDGGKKENNDKEEIKEEDISGDDNLLETVTSEADDPTNWLRHVKTPSAVKSAPEKKRQIGGTPGAPQGRRDSWRVRTSVVSLNGSLHSLSSIPTSPPPGTAHVVRNSRYAKQKRGKVARQALQVYPKSFYQMKDKLRQTFVRKDK